MREPRFWRQRGVLACALTPAALVYGAIAGSRMRRPGALAGVPVICVGNLTSGGAGKTPTAIAVARLLQAEGAKPAFLTRGYGGQLAGPVRVESLHTAFDVGDEALLLAQVAPTFVGRDRVAGAAMAVAAGVSVLIMDDGLQNSALAKDFALVVVDGLRGIGNGFVIPAGPLRAPLNAQVTLASAIAVVGDPAESAKALIVEARKRNIPILTARLIPDAATLKALPSGKVLAFAGIGNPEKFFATLADARIHVAVARAYPDHHRYTAAEAAQLLDEATRDALTLVTTEKDLARMRGDPATAALARAATALPVTMTFEDSGALRALLPRP